MTHSQRDESFARDAFALLVDSHRMATALKKLGSENTEAREYPRGPHAFHAFVLTPSALRCWKDTFAFLDAHV